MDSLPAPAPQRTMTILAAFGITLGVRLVLDTVRELAEAMREGAVRDIVTYAGALAIAHLLFIFVVVRVWAPEQSLRDVLGVRAPSALHAVLAPITGAAMYPALARLDSLVAQRFPLSEGEQELAAELGDASTLGHKAALTITFLLVQPVVTELFFRGALYGRLRRERAEGLTVFGTTAFFVLGSFDPRIMFSTLGLGAVLTWLRARTGSVVPSILAHAGFFATMIAPIFKTGELKDDATWSATFVYGGAAVALALLAITFAHAARSDLSRGLRAQDA